MAELIDRRDIVFAHKVEGSEEYKEGFLDGAMCVLDAIDEMPTIDAKPVVHAHWESTIYTVEKAPGELLKTVGYRCDNCGRIVEEFENYCPSCGAEMYEKRECLSSV